MDGQLKRKTSCISQYMYETLKWTMLGAIDGSARTMGLGVVLRKGVPMCDIELVALDLHVLVANRLVQCATYTV